MSYWKKGNDLLEKIVRSPTSAAGSIERGSRVRAGSVPRIQAIQG